jgi:pepF/M3 family oligoendopeptidase
MAEAGKKLPHWDLSNIFGGLEAPDFIEEMKDLGGEIEALETFLREKGIDRLPHAPTDLNLAAAHLEEALRRFNEAYRVHGTISAFIYAFVTTDSYDKVGARRMSEIEQLGVRLEKCFTRFQGWVGSLCPILPQLYEMEPAAREHHAVLDELVEQSHYLMETRLEDLASELQLSGGGIMWKLQGNVTSQLKAPIERDGKTVELPMTMIRNLAYDPDEAVRRRAYEAEQAAWASVREPVAFALNSVKGAAITLAKWRGRDGVLHAALDQNRIDRATLDALLVAMRDSFPTFRRYLKAKAGRLGRERLPWWDLFAPVGTVNLRYSWPEASAFIVEQFGRFDGDLAAMALAAFEHRWIDAEPRDGKRGGAFCMKIPSVEESRILANFDGSFDQMTTLAHELGHAFHNHCQRGLPMLRRGAPMPLAETASIFCETIVFEAAIGSAAPPAQLCILENQLIGATQVVVDIYSRYLFESETIRRRAEAELGADDFCEMILEAQKATYGEALDPEHLHPYMWLLKPHYYEADTHFYNYPYAFGLLFGLGMYAIYRREGTAFVPRYKELLRATGEGKVADLAARFGIDTRSRKFWDDSLAIVADQVERYCGL